MTQTTREEIINDIINDGSGQFTHHALEAMNDKELVRIYEIEFADRN